ncbi:MAG: hypothetical protein HY525_15160 [Betaproteobacteria bacterium]|nr:hypothetical protein [Betaproteobacteria bacterium]
MIYMVECALTERQTEEDWNRWYHSMKPPHVLPTVPGISSTQRFKGINVSPPAYFAIYSVASADVMTSAAYRNAGGGRFQTEDWKPLITFWNRDLFDGSDAPDVPMDSILLVLDRPAPEGSPLGISFTWLPSIGLDRSTPFRGLAVLGRAEADRLALAAIPGLRTFRPVIPQVTRERPLPEGWKF